MKLKDNTWYFKLAMDTNSDLWWDYRNGKNISLCPFVRAVIAGIFTKVWVGFFVTLLAILVVFVMSYPVLQFFVEYSLENKILIGMISFALWTLLGAGIIASVRKGDIDYSWNKTVIQEKLPAFVDDPNSLWYIFRQYVKALHDKACPIVEIERVK